MRIVTLKEIVFTDRTGMVWKRKELHHIGKKSPLLIPSRESQKIAISDGYYGIEICDGVFCTYSNFHLKKAILLIIEDTEDKECTLHRFIE